MSYLMKELPHNNKKLIYKIKTAKNPVVYEYPNQEFQDMVYNYYKKAKNLKPLGSLDSPYLQLSNLVTPIDLGYHKGGFFYNTDYMKNERLPNKYINLLSVENKSKALSYHDTDFFDLFIKKKEYNALIATPSLIVSSVENYTNYRKLNVPHLAYNDNTIYAELNCYLSAQYKKTPEDIKANFKYVYPNIEYQQITKLEDIKVDMNLDFVDYSVIKFTHQDRKNVSYKSAFDILRFFILILPRLNKGAMVRFQIFQLDNYLLFDIIEIIKRYFDKTYLFKGSLTKKIYGYKYIICDKFIGIDDSEIKKLYELYQKIISMKEDKYIHRILDNRLNMEIYNKYYYEEELEKISIWKQMIQAYKYFENKDNKAIDKLMIKQVINSMTWLEKHNITYNSKFKRIQQIYNHKEIENNLYFLENTGTEVNSVDDYIYNNLFLETLDYFKLSRIISTVNKNKENLNILYNELKIEKNDIKYHKESLLNGEHLFLEISLLNDNIYDYQDYFNDNFRGVYIYKSYDNILKQNAFLIGIDFGKKNKTKLRPIFNELYHHLNNYLELYFFYYYNDIIFKRLL